MNSSSQELVGYREALTTKVFIPQHDAGYLLIDGKDQIEFLQRQTSNDVRHLSSSRSVLTVLTNPSARILDVLRLVKESDVIGIITLPGYTQKTLSYLKSRIFFMDQVTVKDASDKFAQIDLEGPQVSSVLKDLGIRDTLQDDEFIQVDFDNSPLRIIGRRGYAGLGYRLLVPPLKIKKLINSLEESGAIPLSPHTSNILRVEAGLPSAVSELTEEYTPLETGLDYAISDNKGCYTGQEVITRQLSHNKVTKYITGLCLDKSVKSGSRLWISGKAIGKVTSSVISPDFGPIALAIVRRSYTEPGTRVLVEVERENPENGVEGTVTALPFRS